MRRQPPHSPDLDEVAEAAAAIEQEGNFIDVMEHIRLESED